MVDWNAFDSDKYYKLSVGSNIFGRHPLNGSASFGMFLYAELCLENK
jgi:hypothetical protein